MPNEGEQVPDEVVDHRVQREPRRRAVAPAQPTHGVINLSATPDRPDQDALSLGKQQRWAAVPHGSH